MSKRYGRNQKRKHKQELAQLQRDLKLKSAEITYTKSLRHKEAHAINLMADVLNNNFPLLEPKTKYLDRIGDYVQVANNQRPSFSLDPLADGNLTYVIEQLPVIQASTEYSQFTDLQHFYIQVGSRQVAYTLPPQFLSMLSDQEAASHIAHHTAPLILEALNKQGN